MLRKPEGCCVPVNMGSGSSLQIGGVTVKIHISISKKGTRNFFTLSTYPSFENSKLWFSHQKKEFLAVSPSSHKRIISIFLALGREASFFIALFLTSSYSCDFIFLLLL